MNQEMTDEVAFDLGKFNFPAFYSAVSLQSCPSEYKNFFNWEKSIFSSTDKWGYLKQDIFTQISHKLSFIRGRLKGYSVSISENKISIGWANSYDLRDLFANFAYDVLHDLCLEPAEADGGRRYKSNPPNFSVVKSETLGTIPGTPSVEVTGDENVIKYLTGEL